MSLLRTHLAPVVALVLALTLTTLTQPALAAPASKVVGDWDVIDGDMDGEPVCIAIGRLDASAMLMAKTDAELAAENMVALSFIDMAWPIQTGETLDLVQIQSAYDTISAYPVAADHGFFLYDSTFMAEAFFRQVGSGTFTVTLGKRRLGEYRTGDLADELVSLRTCGGRLISRQR